MIFGERQWEGLFHPIYDMFETTNQYMGLSENSVPLNPIVNDHYPY